MLEMALRAFTMFFATVGPVDVAAIYAVLAASATARQRRTMAIKGTLIATVVLVVFAILGGSILAWAGNHTAGIADGRRRPAFAAGDRHGVRTLVDHVQYHAGGNLRGRRKT